MKILRALFVLLLCAVLPMSGLAASGLTGQCPMLSGMPPMLANMTTHDGDSMSEDMPDCDTIESLAAPDNTRHPVCKVTAQCHMGSLYHPVSTPAMHRPIAPFAAAIFHYTQSFSIRAPDGFWRPPRSI